MIMLIVFLLMTEVAHIDRQELFLKKIGQCAVIFDFNDASSELKGKEIKRQTLSEILEYITNNRGVITEPVYPEVVTMVCVIFMKFVDPSSGSTCRKVDLEKWPANSKFSIIRCLSSLQPISSELSLPR